MTIKKRLLFSNILMISVPAVITAFVGALCMVLLWLILQSGGAARTAIPLCFRTAKIHDPSPTPFL